MTERAHFLFIGLGFSMIFHFTILQYLFMMSQSPVKKHYRPSYMVPIKVSQPKTESPKTVIKKKPPPPKKIIRVTKKTKVSPVPVSHHRKPDAEPIQEKEVKPVFGVTQDTVTNSSNTGIGVRIGNTLMKEQEKEYTPPEKVRKYVTVPTFELASLPVFKTRIRPEYPESLKDEDIEGNVLLVVTIDEKGKVVNVEIKHSDHALFSSAAVKSIKRCLFSPAVQNGHPVATKIDIPIKFILDE